MTNINKIEDLKQFNEKLWVLIYYNTNIQIEEVKSLELKDIDIENFLKNNKIDKDKLIKVRFFNENGELLIFKSEQSFKNRVTFDKKTSEKSFDREYFTWGNIIDGDYIKEEKRDIKIKLSDSLKKSMKKELKYKIRNYYDYDEDGLIYFTDYRLLGFIS